MTQKVEKKNDSGFLKFGSIISISNPLEESSFLYIDGFIKAEKVKNKKIDKIDYKSSYDKCLFKIYPHFSNLSKNQVTKFSNKENHNNTTNDNNSNTKNIDKSILISELQDKVMGEFKSNKEIVDKCIDQPVLFGQNIQLLHVTSNKFLGFKDTVHSEIEQENYKLVLQLYPSDYTSFRIMPTLKHQSSNDLFIHLTDEIYIIPDQKINGKIGYIHVSDKFEMKVIKLSINDMDDNDDDEDNKNNINTKKPKNKSKNKGANKLKHLNLDDKHDHHDIQKKLFEQSNIYERQTITKFKTEYNVSTETKSKLKFVLYTNHINENFDYILCGDVIWLNHFELSSCLVANRNIKNGQTKYTLIFEMANIMDSYMQYQATSNGMWIIENENFRKGGFVRWGASYRLKHLSSGKYLSLHNKNQLRLSTKAEQNTLFRFEPLEATQSLRNDSDKNSLYIPRDTFALVRNCSSGLLVSAVSRKEYMNDERSNKLLFGDEDGMEEVSTYDQGFPGLKAGNSEQEAFKIIKGHFNEIWETNFLISCFPILRSFLCDLIICNDLEELDKAILNRLFSKIKIVEYALDFLDNFCMNQLFHTSPNFKHNEINSFRQKVLREQFFIDLLTLILKGLMNTEKYMAYRAWIAEKGIKRIEYDQNRQALLTHSAIQTIELMKQDILNDIIEEDIAEENLRFTEKRIIIAKKIYILLNKICLYNSENQAYLFNLIPNFLKQSKYLSEPINLIINIVKDNEVLLEKITDNLMLDLSHHDNQNIQDKIINIFINIKNDNIEPEKQKEIREKFEAKGSKVSRPVNLITYFFKILKEDRLFLPKYEYFKFFRSICANHERAISTNQDCLYKILTKYDESFFKIFKKFRVNENKLYIMVTDNNSTNIREVLIDDIYKQKFLNKLMCVKIIRSKPEKTHKDEEFIKDLEEQFLLFSDLTKDRNFLWKVKLEKLLNLEFLMESVIVRKDLNKNFRSILMSIMLNLYIDHEPLKQLDLPNMCRIMGNRYIVNDSRLFSDEDSEAKINIESALRAKKSQSFDIKSPSFSLKTPSLKSPKQLELLKKPTLLVQLDFLIKHPERFDALLNNIVDFIRQKVGTIAENQSHLEALLNKRISSQQSRLKIQNQNNEYIDKDQLDDTFLINSMQILSKCLRFGKLKLFNGNYPDFFLNIIKIINYDYKKPNFYLLLESTRKKKFELALKKNSMGKFWICTKLLGYAEAIAYNLTDITSNIADFISRTTEEEKTTREQLIENSVDDLTLHKDPLMRTMIGLHHFLELMKIQENPQKVLQNESLLKIEILEMINFIINMKKNYLITNFLNFYEMFKNKVRNHKNFSRIEELYDYMLTKIGDNINGIMPKIPRTGIARIDEIKKEKISIYRLTNKMAEKKLVQRNEFYDYGIASNINNNIQEDKIPDFDTLIQQQNEKLSLPGESLPNLLILLVNADNSELSDRVLDIIMRLYSQRKEFIDAIRDILLLMDKFQIDVYTQLKKCFDNLSTHEQMIEIWLREFINNEGGLDQLEESIVLLSTIIGSLLGNPKMAFQEILALPNASLETAAINQKIMKFLKAENILFGLFKNILNIFKNILLDTNLLIDAKNQIYILLRLVVITLILFCKKNPENQKILSTYRHYFLQNAHIDGGQIDLLCQIYQDNIELCKAVDSHFIREILRLIHNEGRQEKFLNLLEVVQKCKNTYLPDIQFNVLQALLPREKLTAKEIKLFYAMDRKENQIKFQFDEGYSNKGMNILQRLEAQDFSDTYLDEPFAYHAKLLDVLILTTKSENHFNLAKAKLRTFFTLDYLLEILQNEDNFIEDPSEIQKEERAIKLSELGTDNKSIAYLSLRGRKKGFAVLKPKVMELICELYVNSDQISIRKFMSYIPLLNSLIDNETARIEEYDDNKLIYESYIQYFFNNFILMCIHHKRQNLSIIEREHELEELIEDPSAGQLDVLVVKKRKKAQQKQDLITQNNNALSNLATSLKKKLPSFEKYLSLELRNRANEFIQKNDPKDEKRHKTLIENEKENLKAHEVLLQVGTPESKISSPKNEVQSEEYIDPIFQANMDSQKYWEKFLDMFFHHEKLTYEIKREKIALANAIWNFNTIFKENDMRIYNAKIDPKQIFKKLIDHIDYKNKNFKNEKTIISTLETLIMAIDDPDPREKAKRQDILDHLGATSTLLHALSDSQLSTESELFESYLAFGLKLLEDGNCKIQTSVYKFYSTVHKSENLFKKFYQIITKQITQLKQTDMLNSLSDLGSDFMIIKPTILIKLIKFLQQSTEGHFEELQNYLRIQKNSRTNYDLITAIVELLASYTTDKNFKKANYEIILCCLDALSEFIQGPCHENQKILIDGKFLEVVANFILSKHANSDDSNPEHRKSYVRSKEAMSEAITKEVKAWQLARFKYKTSIILTSLLENKIGDTVIKKMRRAIPLTCLKENVANMFKLYKELYGDTYTSECLKHYEKDPEINIINDKPKYYDLIIETAFSFYFLLEQYVETDDLGIDGQIIEKIRDENLTFEEKEKDLFEIIESSVIGQLIKFVVTFLKTSLKTAKDMGDQVARIAGQTDDILENENEEDKINENFEAGLRFLSKNSCHIEILRNDNIERIHFLKLPFCDYLTEEVRRQFNENVDRSSTKTKVAALLGASEDIIEILKNEERLKFILEKNWLLALLANHDQLWKDSAFTLAILLNIFILFSYSSENLYPNQYDAKYARMHQPRLFLNQSAFGTPSLFAIMGLIMMICSLFVVVLFLCKKSPLIISRAWNKLSYLKPKGILGRGLTYILKTGYALYEVLKNFEIMYYMAYGIFAILGLAIHPFFFAFHLSEILFRYQVLGNILKAFWEPRWELLLTLVLFLLFEYYFSVWAYVSFYSIYKENAESLLLTWLKTIDFTFKDNPATIMDKLADNDNMEPERYIWGLLIFLTLKLLVLAMVQGIIVDKFTQLREEENEDTIDIEGKCFICGNERSLFEKKGGARAGFRYHIKVHHYMWNYVFYIAYLKFKDPNEYNGIETYIGGRIEQEDISWFPVNHALELEGNEEDDNTFWDHIRTVTQIVEATRTNASKVKSNMKKLKDKLENLKSHQNRKAQNQQPKEAK